MRRQIFRAVLLITFALVLLQRAAMADGISVIDLNDTTEASGVSPETLITSRYDTPGGNATNQKHRL